MCLSYIHQLPGTGDRKESWYKNTTAEYILTFQNCWRTNLTGCQTITKAETQEEALITLTDEIAITTITEIVIITNNETEMNGSVDTMRKWTVTTTIVAEKGKEIPETRRVDTTIIPSTGLKAFGTNMTSCMQAQASLEINKMILTISAQAWS